MPRFVLFQPREKRAEGEPDWLSMLMPFKDSLVVVGELRGVRVSVESDLAVVQEIARRNEGVKYEAEVRHETCAA